MKIICKSTKLLQEFDKQVFKPLRIIGLDYNNFYPNKIKLISDRGVIS